MKRITILILSLLITVTLVSTVANDVVIHSSSGHGNNQIYIEHPRVTYDEGLNELSVYFGSTSTINLECVDETGVPYYYIYDEYHSSCTTATYTDLPSGYYTVTIHSIYGITYTGNFTVN